jgi:PAS domain S-box-containing protein
MINEALSVAFLTEAVEATGSALCTVNGAGAVTYVNRAFLKDTGYTADEVLGQPAQSFLPKLSPQLSEEALRSLGEGHGWAGRVVAHRKSGETFWAQATMALVHSGNGDRGFVVAHRDTSSEVLREAALVRSRDLAEAGKALLSALQGTDPLADRVERAFPLLAGHGADPSQCAVWRANAEGALSWLAGCEEPEPPAAVVEAWRNAPQDVRPELSPATDRIFFPMVNSKLLVGVLVMPATATDSAAVVTLTETLGVALALERDREQRARALRAAIEAAQTQHRFLAKVSHEIRTPLNGVLGMLQMLASTELTAEQRDFVHTATASSDALIHIVNDVIEFAKGESGQVELEKIEVDVRQVAEEVIGLVVERADAKKLELVCKVGRQVPRTVLGDPTRLRQVLTNLVSNAVKFTERGEVSLDVQVTSDQALSFTVRDTGIGISPAFLPKLFTAFSQADGSTTRRFGGAGLGLAICKQLGEKMGGKLAVESMPGQGSVFRFVVPLAFAAPAVSVAQSWQAVVAAQSEVLGQAMEEGLARLGASVRLAPDAAAAEAQVKALAPRVLLIDAALAWEPLASAALKAGTALVALLFRGEPPAIPAELKVRLLRKPVTRDALTALITARPIAQATLAALPQLRGRVLVAEDSLVNQKVALGALRRFGLVPTVASDGAEALEALGRERFDLVLMDIEMPKADGHEVTRLLRAIERERRLSRTPVVALTAHVLPEEVERCHAAGMDAFLPKPFKVEQLGVVLQKFLKRAEDP